MVARTPPKQPRKIVVVAPPHLSPTLLRETAKKVDKCMARLQELQYTVTGGIKVRSGENLSPPSRSYFQTNLRSKQESSRIRNANSRRSPPGKLPEVSAEDWRRMSLPAMLVGETMGEILRATRFAKNIVDGVSSSSSSMKTDEPKTPMTHNRKPKPNIENSGLIQARRRRREKQVAIRPESDIPSLTRAKSKINFKECDKENYSSRYIASRVSPRNRPWATKAVLFPNPLFHSQHQKFGKSNRQTPHKFLIKPVDYHSSSKFQVKIKSPPPISISPTKRSPNTTAAAAAANRIRKSFSPSRLANRLLVVTSPLKSRKSATNSNQEIAEIERNRQTAYKFLIKSSSPQGEIKSSLVSLSKKSPPKASKFPRSFSPSRLANRIVMSPLKIRNSITKNERTAKSPPTRFSHKRI
ncbi:hypothetical protein OROGR_004119 [Orobanche gracilis]